MTAQQRVIEERRIRGLTSVRALTRTLPISNETWSKYERTGYLTHGMRVAVAQAFDWPTNWPEDPPPMPPTPPVDQLRQLRAVVQSQGQAVEELSESVREAIAGILERLESVEAWIAEGREREQQAP